MNLIPWIWKLEYHSSSIIVITPASWLSSRKNLILCLHSANVLSSSFLNVIIDEFIDDRNVGMLNIFHGISQGISQDLTSRMVRMSWRALKGLLSWNWVWGQLSRKVGNESDGDLKFGGNGIDCLQTELHDYHEQNDEDTGTWDFFDFTSIKMLPFRSKVDTDPTTCTRKHTKP